MLLISPFLSYFWPNNYSYAPFVLGWQARELPTFLTRRPITFIFQKTEAHLHLNISFRKRLTSEFRNTQRETHSLCSPGPSTRAEKPPPPPPPPSTPTGAGDEEDLRRQEEQGPAPHHTGRHQPSQPPLPSFPSLLPRFESPSRTQNPMLLRFDWYR